MFPLRTPRPTNRRVPPPTQSVSSPPLNIRPIQRLTGPHFRFAGVVDFKVLGGRFLDRWVLEHVRPLVSIRENPRNPTASEHLVRNETRPFLRALNRIAYLVLCSWSQRELSSLCRGCWFVVLFCATYRTAGAEVMRRIGARTSARLVFHLKDGPAFLSGGLLCGSIAATSLSGP